MTLAVLDTVVPGHDRRRAHRRPASHWLDDLAGGHDRSGARVRRTTTSWDLDATDRTPTTSASTPDDSEALVAVVARRENIVGYFAGHTHRNRVRRFAAARDVPFVEVACAKDYPGAWAEYRVYEGGYTQVVRRIAAPGRAGVVRADPRT